MGASRAVQLIKNWHAMQKTQVRSPGGEDPLEKKWQLTPVFLPGVVKDDTHRYMS